MRKPIGLDRFLTFIDAIVAIAVTLLILPLVEMTNELSEKEPIREALWNEETVGKYGSFVLSFLVIFRLWQVHHKLMQPIESYDRVVGVLTSLWALTIVFMPFPTALIGVYGIEREAVAIYLVTLALSSCLLTALAIYLARTPSLHSDDEDTSKAMAVPSAVTAFLVVLATIVGVLVPKINYGALLLLLLTGVLTTLVNRRLHLPRREE